ncbi:hypothetical protein K2173_013970 [Erythroxylum novogranatense]|uniref:Late embryogenesis abundant protein LEA-2 subgroup domain-containing protein n=1 Tax=Erythroxylum novogranatense TaxID=1862640 RepID=A0AAV8SCY9_9ROSI|nr:hypothetical protein K2173_013970 [Erythroxylum novogranatense]
MNFSNETPSSVLRPQALEVSSDATPNTTAPNNNNNNGSRCVSQLTIAIVMWFLILMLVFVIAWVVINPHSPTLRLNSLSISNITLSNSQFVANYEAAFVVYNVNKKVNFCVDELKVRVLYGKAVVSEDEECSERQTPVCVRKMSDEEMKPELGRDSVHSVKPRVFKDISDDWSKKLVNFNVKISLRVRYEYGIWPSKETRLEFSCMNLPVQFMSTKGTGKLMSGGKFCGV